MLKSPRTMDRRLKTTDKTADFLTTNIADASNVSGKPVATHTDRHPTFPNHFLVYLMRVWPRILRRYSDGDNPIVWRNCRVNALWSE